ncbi:chromate transporter, partial [Merdimmobilis hominis]
VPLMKERFVDDYHWIDEEEMMDLVAISQSSPGPLAINASILVGYRMAGVVGALITILATALPPLVIITIVSYFYEAFRSSPIVDAALKGMQAGVSAVILNVIYTMAGNVIKQKDALAIGIMVAAFAATYIFKINVMFVVLACAALGVALSLSRKPGKEGE